MADTTPTPNLLWNPLSLLCPITVDALRPPATATNAKADGGACPDLDVPADAPDGTQPGPNKNRPDKFENTMIMTQ
ncbi:MAG: hypothetical protein KDA61_14030 [Planctomycetales bacterium]|nr:hypothetical protein [Planctomycetales bacterium]